jgi:hypothetical protein
MRGAVSNSKKFIDSANRTFGPSSKSLVMSEIVLLGKFGIFFETGIWGFCGIWVFILLHKTGKKERP